MATMTHPKSTPYLDYNYTNHAAVGPKASVWTVPLGRFLFSLIFIFGGLSHFRPETVAYAASAGVPIPEFLVPFAGVMAIVGALFVLLGFQARLGATLLVLFLVPVTFKMHAFWNLTDPAQVQMQMGNFMKNIGLLGGAFLLMFYGAGPVSIDHHRIKVHHEKR
jgi:putative oxidoreductase